MFFVCFFLWNAIVALAFVNVLHLMQHLSSHLCTDMRGAGKRSSSVRGIRFPAHHQFCCSWGTSPHDDIQHDHQHMVDLVACLILLLMACLQVPTFQAACTPYRQPSWPWRHSSVLSDWDGTVSAASSSCCCFPHCQMTARNHPATKVWIYHNEHWTWFQ